MLYINFHISASPSPLFVWFLHIFEYVLEKELKSSIIVNHVKQIYLILIKVLTPNKRHLCRGTRQGS